MSDLFGNHIAGFSTRWLNCTIQCSENKGADQLHSYNKAGLCLCFCIGKNLVFSWSGSSCVQARGNVLIRLQECQVVVRILYVFA